MLYNWIRDTFSQDAGLWIGTLGGFLMTFFLLMRPFRFLPKDGGKRVKTPDGKTVVINEKSNGKTTGTGIVFVTVFLLMSILFLPFSMEMVFNILLMALMMITGYLDDASTTPWGELLKGLLDLVIAIAAVVVFLCYNSSDVIIFGTPFHFPPVLYGILGVAMIWGSVNVTNCSDGVDGLCGSVSVVSMIGYFGIFQTVMPTYARMGILFCGVLVAYLCFNWHPSKVLMGDAGSRTIGFMLALLAMHSGHPLIILLMSLVFIFDGGIGLIKLALLRVFHWNPFSKILTPFHDHMRKRWKMPIFSIPLVFGALQVVFCLMAWLIFI